MGIVEKLGIMFGELKIRMCTDDSGDYERKAYDILNCFPWGSNIITGDIDNPRHARLFCAAPEMLEALVGIQEYLPDLGSFPLMKTKMEVAVRQSIEAIEIATDKAWDEIKELL